MLLYLDRSDERKGIFFPRRERESNLSLCHDDVGLGKFFTYLNGLSHLFIFMYLFVALFLFIREISFNLNWLRVSAVDSIGILAGSPSASSPSSLPPSPRLLLRFAEAKYILTMYVDLQGHFLGCLLFYPFTEILHLLNKALICLTTVPLMKLIYLPVLILNKCFKAKTLRSLNSWWTLSIDRQFSS